MYFNTCPHCGSNLDPGESCDCLSKTEPQQKPETTENVAMRRSHELRNLCIREGWFTAGSIQQYEKLFEAYENGAGIDCIATILWVCSSNATLEQITATLLAEGIL